MLNARLLLIRLGLIFIAGTAIFQNSPAAAEGSFLSVPVSLTYTSTYWWRGVELNGKGSGVIWPTVGLGLGQTGLSVSLAAGINTDYFAAEKEADRDSAQKYHEIDYGISYAKDIGNIISLGLGAMFVHYPWYDADNSITNNNSFVEGSVSLTLKTVLSPKIDFYYDYYIEENVDLGKNVPQSEDFYIKLSLSQDLLKAGDITLLLSPWLGYYNNAYLDAKGFSDAGLKIGLSSTAKGVTFAGGFYYARSLKSDFQVSYGTGRLKNHFWADFGASYTF